MKLIWKLKYATQFGQSVKITTSHVMIQFKPVHQPSLKSDLDVTCNCCKLAPATLNHLFWYGPKSHVYWNVTLAEK